MLTPRDGHADGAAGLEGSAAAEGQGGARSAPPELAALHQVVTTSWGVVPIEEGLGGMLRDTLEPLRTWQAQAERFGATGVMTRGPDAAQTPLSGAPEMGQSVADLRASLPTQLDRSFRARVEVRWRCETSEREVRLIATSGRPELDVAAMRVVTSAGEKEGRPTLCAGAAAVVATWELVDTVRTEELPVRMNHVDTKEDGKIKRVPQLMMTVGANFDEARGKVEVRHIPRHTRSARFLGWHVPK